MGQEGDIERDCDPSCKDDNAYITTVPFKALSAIKYELNNNVCNFKHRIFSIMALYNSDLRMIFNPIPAGVFENQRLYDYYCSLHNIYI